MLDFNTDRLPGMRAFLCALCAFALASEVAPCAAAESYPARPIRLIVPYPPGGTTDYVAREVAQKLSEAWGQQVVVDNRPGAATVIGLSIVAKAAPDGYTVGFATSAALAVSPALGIKMPFDPLKDFAPVGLIATVPFMLVINPSVPANSVKELIDLARAQPGKLNFGSPGVGTPNHLGGELLKALAGIDIVHVPYKGGAAVVTDLVAGQVQIFFSSIPQIAPFLKNGRIKLLATATPARTRVMPEAPAVAETLPGFSCFTWYGLLLPAGAPNAIVTRFNADLNDALALPDLVQRLFGQGVETLSSTPEGMRGMMESETARWHELLKNAGITADTAR